MPQKFSNIILGFSSFRRIARGTRRHVYTCKFGTLGGGRLWMLEKKAMRAQRGFQRGDGPEPPPPPPPPPPPSLYIKMAFPCRWNPATCPQLSPPALPRSRRAPSSPSPSHPPSLSHSSFHRAPSAPRLSPGADVKTASERKKKR